MHWLAQYHAKRPKGCREVQQPSGIKPISPDLVSLRLAWTTKQFISIYREKSNGSSDLANTGIEYILILKLSQNSTSGSTLSSIEPVMASSAGWLWNAVRLFSPVLPAQAVPERGPGSLAIDFTIKSLINQRLITAKSYLFTIGQTFNLCSMNNLEFALTLNPNGSNFLDSWASDAGRAPAILIQEKEVMQVVSFCKATCITSFSWPALKFSW